MKRFCINYDQIIEKDIFWNNRNLLILRNVKNF